MAKNTLSVTAWNEDGNGQIKGRTVFSVSDPAPQVGQLLEGLLIDTNQATIGLPIAQPRQIMLRNTHATAKITVTWTPFGGAQAIAGTIGPGAAIGLWDPTAAGTSIGISSLKLQSDTSNATYELFIGG